MSSVIGSQLRMAKNLTKTGNLLAAQSIYKNILVSFPNNRLALICDQQLARIHPQKSELANSQELTLTALLNAGNNKSVLATALPLAKLFPSDNFLLTIIAKALARSKNVGLNVKQNAVEPNYAGAYNYIGDALRQNGSFDDAIISYQKALTIKPKVAEVYFNMGCAFQKKDAFNQALVCYRQAISIKPDYAKAHNNIGTVLHRTGALSDALISYHKALSANPEYAEAHYNIGNINTALGESAAAIENYTQAARIDPDDADTKHILDAITGVQTSAPPISYVESLFDEYAANFDQSLQVDLHYEMPIILKNTMLEAQNNTSLGAVLDMGCGTGLAGTAVQDFCDSLEGVDVSKGMLEQAKKKQVYDKLTHANIAQYLDAMPLDFDYFVATDVFNYIGDLKNIFKLIASRNGRKTKIGFSTEHQYKEGFYLQASGRYSHSKGYIQSLCDEYGYKMVHFSVVNLRRENGKFLTGAVYIVEWCK